MHADRNTSLLITKATISSAGTSLSSTGMVAQEVAEPGRAYSSVETCCKTAVLREQLMSYGEPAAMAAIASKTKVT